MLLGWSGRAYRQHTRRYRSKNGEEFVAGCRKLGVGPHSSATPRSISTRRLPTNPLQAELPSKTLIRSWSSTTLKSLPHVLITSLLLNSTSARTHFQSDQAGHHQAEGVPRFSLFTARRHTPSLSSFFPLPTFVRQTSSSLVSHLSVALHSESKLLSIISLASLMKRVAALPSAWLRHARAAGR